MYWYNKYLINNTYKSIQMSNFRYDKNTDTFNEYVGKCIELYEKLNKPRTNI